MAALNKILLNRRCIVGHGGDFEKTTRIQREREERATRGDGGFSRGGEEEADRDGCEEEIG